MRRPLGLGMVLILILEGVGFGLDNGFADNTPPYHEPLIAIIGRLVFLLSAVAYLVLCVVALVRRARGRGGPSLIAIITVGMIAFLVLGITVEDWVFVYFQSAGILAMLLGVGVVLRWRSRGTVA